MNHVNLTIDIKAINSNNAIQCAYMMINQGIETFNRVTDSKEEVVVTVGFSNKPQLKVSIENELLNKCMMKTLKDVLAIVPLTPKQSRAFVMERNREPF